MVWNRKSEIIEDRQTKETTRSVSPDDNIVNITNKDDNINIKLSTMEATNQQMAEREFQYKEDAEKKDMLLQQSQNRVDAVEKRIRERDGQLSTLKEEKAGCMRQIADLKNQLYQLQFEVEETTCDKADITQQWQAKLVDTQRELAEAKRALDDALQKQLDAVSKATSIEQENNTLKKQLEESKESIRSDTAELQQHLDELTAQIAEEKSNATKNKQVNTQEITNLRSMLRSRDDAIQSLQSRVTNDQEAMTKLEAELDTLRNSQQKEEGGMKVKERVDQINNLTKDNDEMKQLVEKQNQALKDMTTKYDKQKMEHDEQIKLVKLRGEEIATLKSEKEQVLQRSNSDSHSRVTTLEVELQKMNEKVDELTSALNESMEELEDLQADVVFKEGRIASLEREIEEASSLLEMRSADNEEKDIATASSRSPPSSPSGNFKKLRQEIERVTRERAQLESDHALQLSLLKSSKDCDMSKVEKERDDATAQLSASTEKIATLEKSRKELEDELKKTREVMDQLDAEEDQELEETKAKVSEMQATNDKLYQDIQELRTKLKTTEDELSKKEESVQKELREAQQALIVLDKERRAPTTTDGAIDAKLKVLDEELAAAKGEVFASRTKLGKTVREKDMIISDLKSELSSKELFADELKEELETLQLSIETGPSTKNKNYGMSIDPEWHEPDTISKLKVQVATLGKEKRMMETELRSKIDTRDSTIATLVLSSGNQESTIVDMKSELNRLQKIVNTKESSENVVAQQLKDLEVDRQKEVNALQDRAHNLTIELKQTNKKLTTVTEELEQARTQLLSSSTMPDVQDLAGRLVVSEQACKMLKNENSDKLKERDSAISNLLLSVQANEGVISNLRVDIESFKEKLNYSNEENRRLQHESEIFAAQIIDQDEEFESLNERLKEKTNEVADMKREIASSSTEMRQLKSLQAQLDELREDKRLNTSRIHELEDELKDAELKKGMDTGIEVQRLKLELEKANDKNTETEERLTNQIESLRKLRNHAMETFEKQLKEKADQIATLEQELLEKNDDGDDEFDDIFLEDDKPRGGGGTSKKELTAKIATLEQEIETLRSTSDLPQLSELKTKLAQSEKLREELVSDRAQFNAAKDREMDRLHKQLSELREEHTARELELLGLIKKLEIESSEMREEFNVRMQDKHGKIVALEQTLAAQEQVVGTMSGEMDQLQNGMEKVSIQRRAEIEELQQELMDYTTKSSRLEREVVALSTKLEDKKLKYEAKVAKLKDKIDELQAETPEEKAARRERKSGSKDHERELEEKNEHLTWLNQSLKDEKDKLTEKVAKYKERAKRDSSPSSPSKSSAKNDKWRNVALQEQVAVLSQRVIELEEENSKTASSLRRTPQSPRPTSILHNSSPSASPVMREKDSIGSARSYSAPKSALRTSTYSDANQANDLLSNSNDEFDSTPRIASTPPPIPRPESVTSKSSDKKKRFSLSRKKSKGETSTGGSTADYNF